MKSEACSVVCATDDIAQYAACAPDFTAKPVRRQDK